MIHAQQKKPKQQCAMTCFLTRQLFSVVSIELITNKCMEVILHLQELQDLFSMQSSNWVESLL